MKEITNESGTFVIGASGELYRFVCAPKNCWDSQLHSAYGGGLSACVGSLVIPEGVTRLPANAFRGYRVVTKVVLPNSLEVLGTGSGGAFSRCELGEVVLPRSFVVGADAFRGSHIGKIVIPPLASKFMCQQLALALRSAHFWYSTDTGLPKELMNLWQSKPNAQEELCSLSSPSGFFWVNSCGVLVSFDPHRENRISTDGKKTHLLHLHIPEGVAIIPEDMFRHHIISFDITFPGSLRYIGSGYGCAFADAVLPDLTLPKHLELLGDFSFGHSYIRSLTIPGSIKDSLLPMQVRQFKDAHLGQLRVPLPYRAALEQVCAVSGPISITQAEDPLAGPVLCAAADNGRTIPGELVCQLLCQILKEEIS